MRSRPTSVIDGTTYSEPNHPGFDSLLQLAARLVSAHRAIILHSDHPGKELAKYAVNIPLIARNGRHLGHLCLNPANPLTECQADNLRLVAESLTQLMMLTPDKLVTE